MESHVSGSIKFKLWIIFICTIDVITGEENDTQVSNVTVSKEYCLHEVPELIVLPQEIGSYNSHDERVHIKWSWAIKPNALWRCIKRVNLYYGGDPNDTKPVVGFNDWRVTKLFPLEANTNAPFKIRREFICFSKNKIFLEFFSFKTHYHPTAVTFEKTKLSACPTPLTRPEPISNEAIWALVAGGLFFFIVCLLCLLRPPKEEETPSTGRWKRKEEGSVSSEEALGY